MFAELFCFLYNLSTRRILSYMQALCCVLSAAQGFLRFWRFWAAYSMPSTQTAPLHFTESDDNQPNRKRSHDAARRLHDTVNRGTVQAIYAEGRYFTNQASIDFSRLISSQFRPKNSANPIRLEDVHGFIRETVLTMVAGIKLQSVNFDGRR